MIIEKTVTEQNLDPTDWNELRRLGHRMVDDMMYLLQTIREEPVWRQPTVDAKTHFQQPLPREGQPVADVYAEFLQYIFPYPQGNIHPRFFSWVQSTGTPLGMLADMLASGMSPNVTIGDHAAVYVDQQVINWCKELLNFPATGSGILLSGGSMANLTGLLVARQSANRQQMRQRGIDKGLVLYCSAEAHSCVQKAVEVMGLGSDALRRVPVGADYRMNMDALGSMLAADLASGLQPFCIVGNAGTVNTGAIDPLDDIADLCRQHGLWFHVDGAFGALAKLAPALASQLVAIERADSVAFDLHKWMSMPYEVGCVLIRDAALHRETFALNPSYLLKHERGLAAGPDSVSNYGVELSRGFKALKIWMNLKAYGADKFAQVIAQNIGQMQYMAQRIEAEPELELLAPAPMNIVCYRFKPSGMTTDKLNALNKEILMQLHERAIATPSYTLLNGQYAIRVANVNHRTTRADLDALIAGTLTLGRKLVNQ